MIKEIQNIKKSYFPLIKIVTTESFENLKIDISLVVDGV